MKKLIAMVAFMLLSVSSFALPGVERQALPQLEIQKEKLEKIIAESIDNVELNLPYMSRSGVRCSAKNVLVKDGEEVLGCYELSAEGFEILEQIEELKLKQKSLEGELINKLYNPNATDMNPMV